MASTYYLDPGAGNDSTGDGLTMPTAWKSIAQGATGVRLSGSLPIDIRVRASPDPTLIGSATLTEGSATFTLPNQVSIDVDMCEAAWTVVSANTASSKVTTSFKQGTGATQVNTTAIVTPQLMAYKSLGGVVDFSAYQQLSFWIRSLNSSAANTFKLSLCSDAAGATPVNNFIINIATNGQWVALALDNGSALSSSIQSIALYNLLNTTNSTFINLDAIMACKAPSAADSITLTSMIGPNDGLNGWYNVASISGTTITIDQGTTNNPSVYRGWGGTTGTYTLYKRDQFIAPTTFLSNVAQKSGTDPINAITYQGGYNAAGNAITGETWFDLCPQTVAASSQVFNSNGFNYLKVDKISGSRAGGTGIQITSAGGNGVALSNMMAVSGQGQGCQWTSGAGNSSANNLTFVCNNSIGFAFQASGCEAVSNIKNYSNFAQSMSLANVIITGTNYSRNNAAGVVLGTDARIYNLNSSTDLSSAVSGISADNEYLFNCVFSEATFVSSLTNYNNNYLFSQDHQGVVGNCLVVTDGGQWATDTVNRDTPTGYAWKGSVTAVQRSINYPLKLSIAKVVCAANKLVTVTCRGYRDSGSINGGIWIQGGIIPGVASDLTSLIVGTGAYETLTFTFTPTQTWSVEVYATAYGGTTNNVWFQNVNITQAP